VGLQPTFGNRPERVILPGEAGMKRNYSLGFDPLEARKLLTTAHVSTPQPIVPIAINGTLTVNPNDSTQFENPDSSWTTTVPVSGVINGLGKVKGTWETSVDPYGDYMGPDLLELQTKTPKGSFDIAFNNVNTTKPTKVSPGVGFYQHGQHLEQGTGAYSHVSESGSIELMVNDKKGSVTSMVLISVPPTTPTTA
jgi:hypothetical protein